MGGDNKKNRVSCRLTNNELKELKKKSAIEDEGNKSLTMRKALRFYLFNK